MSFGSANRCILFAAVAFVAVFAATEVLSDDSDAMFVPVDGPSFGPEPAAPAEHGEVPDDADYAPFDMFMVHPEQSFFPLAYGEDSDEVPEDASVSEPPMIPEFKWLPAMDNTVPVVMPTYDYSSFLNVSVLSTSVSQVVPRKDSDDESDSTEPEVEDVPEAELVVTDQDAPDLPMVFNENTGYVYEGIDHVLIVSDCAGDAVGPIFC